jgi:hypothetical protein
MQLAKYGIFAPSEYQLPPKNASGGGGRGAQIAFATVIFLKNSFD